MTTEITCKHVDVNGKSVLIDEPIYELYNKNGEYVEGYGHNLVYIQTDSYKRCPYCGWREGCSDVVLPRP